MLDITLRPVKDGIFDPLCAVVPGFISPLFITFLGFISGLASCFFAIKGNTSNSLILWLTNRALDCVDGALARRRNQASDLGGFLDLLSDFIVYSLIPISCAAGACSSLSFAGMGFWLSVAAVEASFHINNFILFFIAAILEKMRASSPPGVETEGVKELTSVAMRPALIEGFESGIIFTVMIVYPLQIERLNWIMTALVAFGICQRIFWVVPALNKARYTSEKKQ